MKLQQYLTEVSIEDRMKRAHHAYKAYTNALSYTEYHGWQHPDKVFDGINVFKGMVLFRGTKIVRDRFNHTQRTDRRPLDTNYEIHLAADDWFQKEFGWRPRSEGLLCIPSFPHARSYTADNDSLQTYMIFPNGPFKYVWSPKVNDFYQDTLGIRNDKDIPTALAKRLETMGYTDTGVEKNENQEVMIKAASFTFINALYYPAYCLKYNIPFTSKQDQWFNFIRVDAEETR